jgi:alpha-1,2-mannosyltransferase
MDRKAIFTWISALSLVLIFCLAYAFFTWGSLQNFNEKVDPCETLFCDFTIHYYPTAQSIFEVGEPVHGYLYSPFFAILTSPLGNLPLEDAARIWGWIQVLLLALLFIAPLSALKLDTLTNQILYAGIFFTSLPVLHNFKWGQVSSLMTLTAIAAFMAHRSGRSIWAGVLLALSTSVKYYPGIFILYFLLKRDKRAVIAFTLTCFLLLFVLPVLLLGFDHWLNFMNLSLQKLSVLNDTFTNPNTQYFPYVLARLLHIDPSRVLVLKILRLAGILIAFCNLGLLWFLHKRALDPKGLLSIALLFCTLPFLIETSWHHYFIFLPFLQIAFHQTKKDAWMTIPVILSILLSSIFPVSLFAAWQDYTKWGFSFLASSLILVLVYLLAFKTYREGRGEYK